MGRSGWLIGEGEAVAMQKEAFEFFFFLCVGHKLGEVWLKMPYLA